MCTLELGKFGSLEAFAALGQVGASEGVSCSAWPEVMVRICVRVVF